MVMLIEAEMSETEKTVQHLMKRHKLEGKLKEWAAPYCEELEKVLSTRCEELFVAEIMSLSPLVDEVVVVAFCHKQHIP